MNDLNMEYLFPSNVFSSRRTEFISQVLPIFEEYSSQIKNERGVDPYYPSVMTRDMIGDSRLLEFSNVILGYAWQALTMQGYNMTLFSTFFSSLWGQEHHKNSSMEYHIHGENSQISGFYFLDVPQGSMEILYHDPRAVKVYANLPEADLNTVTPATSIIKFIPEPGNLFLSNSWLPHSFTKNRSDHPVKFIHFNINVMYNQQNQQYKPAIVV